MKKAFMALKFHDGAKDQQKVDELTKALKGAGIENFVAVRDVEKYGEVKLPPNSKLMIVYAFPAMRKSDMLIVEFSKKGVGLGIVAGYAYAIGLPIYVIAKTGSDISLTISNLATKVIFYDDPKRFKAEFEAGD